MRHCLLHHARRLHDLRQEHLARPEQVADDVHPVHQRSLDHLDRAIHREAHLFGIRDDMRVDTLDQRMFEAFFDLPAAPFLGRLFLRGIGALVAFGERDQPLGRRFRFAFDLAVEDDVLARGAEFGVDRVIDVELPGVDDRHVEPRRDCMIEEDAVHRAAHRLVAAKTERQVREAAREMRVRAADADHLHRLDEVDRIIVMLFKPRRDREDIGIEDDVLGRKADRHQELVGALADLDLAVFRVGLPDLVERHHDDRGAIGHAFARMAQELLLAFLHADRIDDRLAGDTFEAGLDHIPFRAVDHHRNACDIGLGGDQLQEGRHRIFGVEQAFVHIDVDHLRAIFDLLARDLDRRSIIVGEDELLERRRSGDVGALADVDEAGGGGGGRHWIILERGIRRRAGGRERDRRTACHRH